MGGPNALFVTVTDLSVYDSVKHRFTCPPYNDYSLPFLMRSCQAVICDQRREQRSARHTE